MRDEYATQILTLVKVNHGLDDDGHLVVNYELRRGDDLLVASFQSTDIDVGIFTIDGHIDRVVDCDPRYRHAFNA